MSLRWKRRLVYAALHFGGAFLLYLLASPGSGFDLFAVLWLLFGYWPAQILSRPVTAALVKTISCPGCGFEMDAVSRWTVGQYTDHRERHILTVRSPIDGSVVGQTDCPQCGSTILVQ